MTHSRRPQRGLHEVFYSTNGTLSQILDETIVTRALRQEISESSGDAHRNSISGFRTALLWSTVFWVLLGIAVGLAIW